MSELHCDFCGEATTREEVVVIPTKTFTIPEIRYVNLSWGWGMDAACADLWKAGDLPGLLDRAVAHHEEGEDVRSALRMIYQHIRYNQNGPLRGWHPMDDPMEGGAP